ncbi:MAG TPA: PDZ domain-containing protein [Candidatus Acidoferrales bacterium]|nr:PDZ domain-containing protein [Candidatus Acidoferrales bacterium]
MKSSPGHWCVNLFAAALIFPAGLAAQQTRPAPPVVSQDWIDQTVEQSVAQAREGMARAMEALPAEAGWLGVSASEVTGERARQAKLPRAEGVFINEVEPNSPAEKAGVRANDILVAYNGQAVEGVLQFDRLVRETPPGRTVSIEVWRAGSREKLSAQVESRRQLLESRLEGLNTRIQRMPRPFVMVRPFMTQPLLGIRAENVSGQLGQYFEAPGGRGILVVEVTSGSPADKAGLKAGDVIYHVEGKPAHSVGELEQALRDNCSASGVSLGVVRKGLTLAVRAQIHCPEPPAPQTIKGYGF